MFWDWPRRLRTRGIVGMNERNARYVMGYNPRRLYPLVDDKLRTKELAQAANIAVPPLFGVITSEHEAQGFLDIIGDHRSFVIKPAHGSGGDGIVVIKDRRGASFVRANGSRMSQEQLRHHISNVLSGMFSLGGMPDKAMFEYCVKFDTVFNGVTFQGVPDIRTLVFRGVPIAAMARLPTRDSDGKANLHQGAIGVGIDLQTGRTMNGVWHNAPVSHHPDTGEALSGIQIPGWDTLLDFATRCYDLVKLGYLGVDVVLDRELGPLVLELNARPGLSIQLANKHGLRPELERVAKLETIPEDAAARVAIGLDRQNQAG
ncbi:MAG: alpha-L-glutamate ligase-like protein [Panacagrimonas sp.]